MISKGLRDTGFLVCIAVTFLFASAIVACGGSATDTAPPEVEGPALIMFYTDN